MKTFLHSFSLAVMLLVAGACSKSKSDLKQCDLAPPSWIQGVWTDAIGAYKFTFTANNMVMVQMGLETDLCRAAGTPTATVEEVVKSANSYSVRSSNSMGAVGGYSSFQRTGDGRMTYCPNELPCVSSFPFSTSILLVRQ